MGDNALHYAMRNNIYGSTLSIIIDKYIGISNDKTNIFSTFIGLKSIISNISNINNIEKLCNFIPADFFNKYRLFEDVCAHKNISIVNYYYTKYSPIVTHACFMNACMNKNMETIRWLLNMCPDFDLHNYDDLLYITACSYNSVEILEYLIHTDGNINDNTVRCCLDCAKHNKKEDFYVFLQTTYNH